MIGPERGDTPRKARRLLEEIAWAESAGINTAWMPQVPSDMDALQMVSLLGMRTSRIELGTAVVPLQAQRPAG
jgi:alkanesulfonate monooxygenase SsuD/methylene tetrahydromethanopterin reductase-like flavin-dependent oxidoreductase (luciferase family)